MVVMREFCGLIFSTAGSAKKVDGAERYYEFQACDFMRHDTIIPHHASCSSSLLFGSALWCFFVMSKVTCNSVQIPC